MGRRKPGPIHGKKFLDALEASLEAARFYEERGLQDPFFEDAGEHAAIESHPAVYLESAQLAHARADREPHVVASFNEMHDELMRVVKTLKYREREIIKLRYGLGDGYIYTLKEVAHIFKVTQERIRQIEAKAIRQLQQPRRHASLRIYA